MAGSDTLSLPVSMRPAKRRVKPPCGTVTVKSYQLPWRAIGQCWSSCLPAGMSYVHGPSVRYALG